tara:strand:- start:274 stop:1575 length:1302 start_codon:yes stop_codon:yes gene_type:complete
LVYAPFSLYGRLVIDGDEVLERMNVLSLFDGMACGRIALDRANITVDNYYASEIDKWCIKVAQENYPEIIQVGSVEDLDTATLPKIDLVMGGSPCQGFSYAGRGLNFKDPRSALFFEFVRILDEIKPEFFLLENVRMKKENRDIISRYMGCEPFEINSALVSAQNRKRLFWTNIPLINGLPDDKRIALQDILEQDVDEKYTVKTRNIDRYLPEKIQTRFIDPYNQTNIQGDKSTALRTNSSNGNMWIVDREKAHCLDASYGKGQDPYLYFKKGRRQLVLGAAMRPYPRRGSAKSEKHDIDGKERAQQLELRKDEKSNSITTANYKDALVYEKPVVIGNIFPSKGQNGNIYDLRGKSKTLSSGGSPSKRNSGVGSCNSPLILQDKIRRLTPAECERLQTVPDGFTACVSDTQRYKMLGNGWTVDVIAHILGGIK